jgi:hypothetical protein
LRDTTGNPVYAGNVVIGGRQGGVRDFV